MTRWSKQPASWILLLALLLSSRLAAQVLVFTDAFPTNTPQVLNPSSVNLRSWEQASAEPDEPAHDGRPAFRSLWARFTAKDSGLIRFSVPLEDTPAPRIAVYTNATLATLGRVTSRSLGGFENELGFEAVAGVTYSIALDWIARSPRIPSVAFSRFYLRASTDRPLRLGETVTLEVVSTDPALELGAVSVQLEVALATTSFTPHRTLAVLDQPPRRITLTNQSGGHWRVTARQNDRRSTPTLLILRPPADDIADATELPSNLVGLELRRDMPVGSIEPGEYLPLTNQWFGIPTTVWWKWTPTTTGPLSVFSSPHGLWAAYDGDPLASLPLKAGFNGLNFEAIAGRTYYLQMVVANTPIFHTNRIQLRRLPTFDIQIAGAVPDNSIISGTFKGRGLLAPSSAVTVTGINLWPGESYSGFRMEGFGALPQTGQTAEGMPIYSLNLQPEGSVLQLSGTNLAGVMLSSDPVFVAARPANDSVDAADPLPLTGPNFGPFNGRLASASADDPAIPGATSVRSRWWKYEGTGEATLVFQSSTAGTKPIPGTLAVFRGKPGPDSKPLAWARTNALRWSVQTDVAPGETLYLLVEAEGDFHIAPPVVHPFRWRNPITRGYSWRSFDIELSPPLVPGVVLQKVSFDGDTHGARSLPANLRLYTWSTGELPIVFEYRMPNGATGTFRHTITVRAAGDEFSDARLIQPDIKDRLTRLQVSFTGATPELGEPNPFGPAQHTLWYQWKPPRTGVWQIEATNAASCIALFQGEHLGNLQFLAAHVAGSTNTQVRVDDQTTYSLLVARPDPGTGLETFFLRWVPENDSFSKPDPLALSSDFELRQFDPLGASGEPGEPAHGSQPASRSLWWIQHTTEAGYTELELYQLFSTPTPARVALYRGDSLDSLVAVPVQVVQDDQRVKARWNHKAGETLRMAVDMHTPFRFSAVQTHSLAWGTVPSRAKVDRPSRISVVDLSPESGELEVNFTAEHPSTLSAEAGDPLSRLWTPKGQRGFEGIVVNYRHGEEPWRSITTYVSVAPANDDFIDAEDLPWEPEAISRLSASRPQSSFEPEEPATNHLSGGSTWWRWTAPFTGEFRISKPGLSPPAIALFTGNTQTGLELVGVLPNGSEPFTHPFSATAGQIFHLAVGDSNSSMVAQAAITLRASNDAFAARIRLPPAGGRFQGNTLDATLEPDEPQQSPWRETGSVWFEYTASADGYVSISTQPFRPCTVHRGDSLTQLRPWSDGVGVLGWPHQVPVQAGETICIRVLNVQGSLAPEGNFVLHVLPTPTRLNASRDFAGRQQLQDRQLQPALLAPWGSFPESFLNPALYLPDYLRGQWWTFRAERAGRLRVHAWLTNETAAWLRLAPFRPEAFRLDAIRALPDGSLALVKTTTRLGGPLVADLAAGESIELRLAMPFDLFQINLIAELGEVVPPPTLKLVGDGTNPALEMSTLPGDPWSIEIAFDLNGPWWQFRSGFAESNMVREVLDPGMDEPDRPRFFRASSP